MYMVGKQNVLNSEQKRTIKFCQKQQLNIMLKPHLALKKKKNGKKKKTETETCLHG